MASFSSVIGSVAFTMFWNMVLFLCEDKKTNTDSMKCTEAVKRQMNIDWLQLNA